MEGMLFERGKIVWNTRMACCNTRICSQCPCSAQATNWKAPFPPKCCQRAEHNTPVEVGPLRSFLVQPVCSTWTSCLLLPPGVFPANILQQFAIVPPKKHGIKMTLKSTIMTTKSCFPGNDIQQVKKAYSDVSMFWWDKRFGNMPVLFAPQLQSI